MRGANQRIRQGALSRGGFDQPIFRFFKKNDHLLSCHGWEARKDIIDRFAGFKVVKQGLHGNPCAMKYGRSPITSGLREIICCFMAGAYSFVGLTGNVIA